jgi:hypothetical protein
VDIYVEAPFPDVMTVDLICAIAQEFPDESFFDVNELIEVGVFGDGELDDQLVHCRVLAL